AQSAAQGPRTRRGAGALRASRSGAATAASGSRRRRGPGPRERSVTTRRIAPELMNRRAADKAAVQALSGARQPFIGLTGLSGSGKSQAIRALEDLGYFCVDNLPAMLIPTLAKLALRPGGIEKVAIVADIRERNFLSQLPTIVRQLRTMRRLNFVL